MQHGTQEYYQTRQEIWNYERYLRDGNLYEAIFGEEDRDKRKSEVQKFFNFEKFWVYDEVMDFFKARFPRLFKLLKFYKLARHPLHLDLQGRELAVIREVAEECEALDIPVFPVTDELGVPERDLETVSDFLLEKQLSHTGCETKIGVKFFDSETLERKETRAYRTKQPCPDDLCPDCWSENKAIRIESPFPCKHIKDNVANFPIHPKGDTGTNAG